MGDNSLYPQMISVLVDLKLRILIPLAGGICPPFGRPHPLPLAAGALAERGEQLAAFLAALLFPVPAPYENKFSTGPKPKTAGRFRDQLLPTLCGRRGIRTPDTP